MNLNLFFLSAAKPELAEVVFSPTVSDVRVARRGKGLVFTDDQGSFQWTKAVKAFASLCVGTNLARFSESTFELSGQNGSQAASLDYAISKPTDWIADLFGGKDNGRDYRRLLFRVANSEQKLPGPVVIHLSNALDGPDDIQIYLDDIRLHTAFEVLTLFEVLGGNTFPVMELPTKTEPVLSMQSTRPDGATGAEPDAQEAAKTSKAWYESTAFLSTVISEARQSLGESEVLEPLAIEEAERRLFRDRPEEVLKKLAPVFQQLRSHIPPAALRYRTSFERGDWEFTEPLHIGCPPMAITTLLLLRTVTAELKIPIEIYSHHPSSSSIISSIEEEALDYVILSWGALEKLKAGGASSKGDALMLLPRTGFYLLVPEDGSDARALPRKEEWEILLSIDEAGYPFRYLESVQRLAKSEGRNVRGVNASIVEIITKLTTGRSRAIVSFPFSAILELHFNYKKLPTLDYTDSRIGDNILLQIGTAGSSNVTSPSGSRSDFNNDHLLSAMRHAWYMLLEDEELLARSVQSLLSDTNYIKSLKRLGGLYRIPS